MADSPESVRCIAGDSLLGSRGFTTRVLTSTLKSMSATRDKAAERGTVLWNGRRDQTRRMGGRSSGARARPVATSTGHHCQATGAQARSTAIGAAGTGTPIMKMQLTSLIQVGVMPLQGTGAVS